MSDVNQNEDIVVDELQDELVEDSVEVSGEDLEEAAAPKTKGVGSAEVDGEKAAADVAGEIKKSAPAKQPEPKTKAGMLQAAYNKMSKMKKNEMMKAYEALCSESLEETDEDAILENNFEEDLNVLVDSEATLSEGFKDKASVIFEAALKTKLAEHVDRLEEQYAEELAEETSRIEADLVEKVDGYLNYVVEQWMEDNKVAIESGLRTEIAENFMSALHGVFVENYIDVPESKVDLVDEMSTKIDELEENLNAKIQDNVDLKEAVAKLSRDKVVREASVGLSEAQAEKLKGLTADVDFIDEETFEEKVQTIKESYFKETKVAEQIVEDTAIETEESEVSPRMAAYLNALKKSN